MEKRAETICDLLDEIYALGHMMQLVFETKENAGIQVNPHAVARFGNMITANIIKINEALDNE
jgi:DNA-binding transcriptional regulator WhiA